LEQLTTGTNNIAIGLGAASDEYGLTTGSGNVVLGVNSGLSCITGSNNTFLGYNTLMYGATYIVESIALGANARITGYNQFMVAPNITQFNIPGLTALGLARVPFWNLTQKAMCFPLQGPTRLSWPLTLPLWLSMPLIIFGSLTQLYQTPQRITSPLSHGGV